MATQDLLETEDETKTDPTAMEWTFYFRWEAPRGKVYEGMFTNRILTFGGKDDAACLAARMRTGLPVESMNSYRSDMIERVAWMTKSLIKRPEWARNLASIIDDDCIVLLYAKVEEHEALFREPRKTADDSEEAVSVDDGGGGAEAVVAGAL